MIDIIQNCKIFNYLEFNCKRESSSITIITITVGPILINKIKRYTLEIYKKKIKTKGFGNNEIPQHYVEKNCSIGINESCSKFILKFFVLDFLEEKMQEKKMVCIATPKLSDIKIGDNGSISYTFKTSIISNISPDNWEKIHFVPPRRKLYKDLDRQAVLFIKAAGDEQTLKSKKPEESKNVAQDGDWVCFNSMLLNNNNQPAIRDYKNNFWLKLDTKYVVTPLHKSFLGREENESFLAEDLPILGAPNDLLSIKGKFKVTTQAIIKSDSFSLPRFKTIFELNQQRDIHEKLIEIFSFRNDISQRRLIIDETFRVMFGKIRFEIPRYLVLRRQEMLLDSIKHHPDYNVYKMSCNFEKQLGVLAEKQIKEEALVRQIGYNEAISISHEDILDYLNLFNHPRLVEFIYFLPTLEYIQDVCLPVKESALKLSVFKEKVLNFIIKKLSCS